MRFVLLLVVGWLAGCQGPPAPDAELCRDVIERLCRGPICLVVDQTLAPGSDCRADLDARARCDTVDFAGDAPLNRARVLDCRTPLLRAGIQRTAHPDCEDVAEALQSCPDLVRFLRGQP